MKGCSCLFDSHMEKATSVYPSRSYFVFHGTREDGWLVVDTAGDMIESRWFLYFKEADIREGKKGYSGALGRLAFCKLPGKVFSADEWCVKLGAG